MSNTHTVGHYVIGQFGPLVHFGNGCDENVAAAQWPDVKHGYADVIPPDDPPGQLTADDLCED